MRLLLVRHGQTPSNVAGLLDSARPGPGLTPLGTRQAGAIPGALEGETIDGIAISTLTRTALTAAPLAEQRGLEPIVIDDLREVESGDLEGATGTDAHRTYLETCFAWAHGDLAVRMPGGPDGTEFFARFDGAVRAVADTGWASAVVVSHGAALRTWVAARVDGLDAVFIERTPLENTALIEIEGDPEQGWRFVRWSDGPVGGQHLTSVAADDPTGEAVDDLD